MPSETFFQRTYREMIESELRNPTTPRAFFDQMVDDYNNDNPLHFATIYLRTYGLVSATTREYNEVLVREDVTYGESAVREMANPPFPMHTNPFYEDLYTEAEHRQHLPERTENNIVTIRFEGDVHTGDMVRTTESGAVVVMDADDDEPFGIVVGHSQGDHVTVLTQGRAVTNRRDQSGNLVEVELNPDRSPTRGMSPILQLNILEDVMEITHRHYPMPGVMEERDRKAKRARPKYQKYFSAKTGLKHMPVKRHSNGWLYFGSRGIDPETYNGCAECFWYSIVFHAKRAPDGTKIIDTDEDFEKVKAHFVKHFNKKHPEIVAKKMALRHPEKMT